MCIIIYKPIGKTVDKATLRRCWNRHRDGAGFMFNSENKVWGNKGFMCFDSLLKGLENSGFYDPETQLVSDKQAVTIHFRLGNTGKICPQNCHPFPITNDINCIQACHWEANIGVAHNGTIYIELLPGGISDTITFVATILSSPIIHKNLDDPAILSLIKHVAPKSQFIFLYGNGQTMLIGKWINDAGIYYSNAGYRKNRNAWIIKTKIEVGIQKNLIGDVTTSPPFSAIVKEENKLWE